MPKATHRIVRAPSASLATVFVGLLTGGAGWANEKSPDAIASETPNRNMQQLQSGASSARKPIDFLLTQAELRSFISRYEARTGEVLTAPILEEEVLVTAPNVVVPMRDVSQDVWGGIAAPFWAIMNPTQAWRILVPIPPKGKPKEAEPPAPDPR